MWLGSHYDAVTLFSFIYIMLEPLNSLDTGSYIEKCFLLFDFLSIFFDLYRRPVFGPIRNDSIISISSISEIQYRYIPHNIYIILYTIYYIFNILRYAPISIRAILNTWTVDSFFFFFHLSFHLFEWNQRSVSLWSELHFYLSFYSYPFLRADPL